MGGKFAAVVLVLGATGVAVLAWRLMDVVLLNPTMTAAAGGALLVLAGVMSAAVLGVVDGWADSAAAFGATVGHNRTRESQILDTAAGLRERNAKASYTEAQALGALPPIYTNGNGKATEEVWTG